jgi:hypothetical protein
MKWAWKITRIVGIDVYVHATFFILIVWIGLSYWTIGQTVAAVVEGVGFILALFGCVVLHLKKYQAEAQPTNSSGMNFNRSVQRNCLEEVKYRDVLHRQRWRVATTTRRACFH